MCSKPQTGGSEDMFTCLQGRTFWGAICSWNDDDDDESREYLLVQRFPGGICAAQLCTTYYILQHTTYIHTSTPNVSLQLQTKRSGLDSNTNQPCTVICVCTHRVSLVSQGCLPVPGWSTRSVTTAPVGAPGFPAPHPRERHASAVAI